MNRSTLVLIILCTGLLVAYAISMTIMARLVDDARREIEARPVIEKLKVVTNEIERLRVVERESQKAISDAGAFSNVTNVGDAIRLYHSIVD